MELEIRRLAADDSGLFENVADDVFDAPIEVATLTDFLSAPNQLMVAALANGRIVGQARGIIHMSPDEDPQLYIDNLGVAPEMRRRRIGHRLVQELFNWGSERRCAGAWVATESDNLAAIRLYEHLGAKRQDMVYFDYELPVPDRTERR